MDDSKHWGKWIWRRPPRLRETSVNSLALALNVHARVVRYSWAELNPNNEEVEPESHVQARLYDFLMKAGEPAINAARKAGKEDLADLLAVHFYSNQINALTEVMSAQQLSFLHEVAKRLYEMAMEDTGDWTPEQITADAEAWRERVGRQFDEFIQILDQVRKLQEVESDEPKTEK